MNKLLRLFRGKLSGQRQVHLIHFGKCMVIPFSTTRSTPIDA